MESSTIILRWQIIQIDDSVIKIRDSSTKIDMTLSIKLEENYRVFSPLGNILHSTYYIVGGCTFQAWTFRVLVVVGKQSTHELHAALQRQPPPAMRLLPRTAFSTSIKGGKNVEAVPNDFVTVADMMRRRWWVPLATPRIKRRVGEGNLIMLLLHVKTTKRGTLAWTIESCQMQKSKVFLLQIFALFFEPFCTWLFRYSSFAPWRLGPADVGHRARKTYKNKIIT